MCLGRPLRPGRCGGALLVLLILLLSDQVVLLPAPEGARLEGPSGQPAGDTWADLSEGRVPSLIGSSTRYNEGNLKSHMLRSHYDQTPPLRSWAANQRIEVPLPPPLKLAVNFSIQAPHEYSPFPSPSALHSSNTSFSFQSHSLSPSANSLSSLSPRNASSSFSLLSPLLQNASLSSQHNSYPLYSSFPFPHLNSPNVTKEILFARSENKSLFLMPVEDFASSPSGGKFVHYDDLEVPRNPRSALEKFSHHRLMRFQLYSANAQRILQLLPNGTVGLTDDKMDSHTYLEIRHVPYMYYTVMFRSVATGIYLCMDSKGKLYTTCFDSPECEFLHKTSPNHYTILESKNYSQRFMSIGADHRIKRAKKLIDNRLLMDHFFLEMKTTLEETKSIIKKSLPNEKGHLRQYCAAFSPVFANEGKARRPQATPKVSPKVTTVSSPTIVNKSPAPSSNATSSASGRNKKQRKNRRKSCKRKCKKRRRKERCKQMKKKCKERKRRRRKQKKQMSKQEGSGTNRTRNPEIISFVKESKSSRRRNKPLVIGNAYRNRVERLPKNQLPPMPKKTQIENNPNHQKRHRHRHGSHRRRRPQKRTKSQSESRPSSDTPQAAVTLRPNGRRPLISSPENYSRRPSSNRRYPRPNPPYKRTRTRRPNVFRTSAVSTSAPTPSVISPTRPFTVSHRPPFRRPPSTTAHRLRNVRTRHGSSRGRRPRGRNKKHNP